MNVNRRKLLCGTIGLTASVVLSSSRAVAEAADVEAAIKAISGGADIGDGKIKLKAPEIAENGNSVPISISVDSPMTEDSYVESVSIFADGNPNPEVVTFNFTPASGEAFASTRMRLAQTQNVVAVAKMNDGTFFTDSSNVKVTIGGCGG